MAVMFDTIMTVDWSGGNQKSITPCADAIWASVWQYGTHNYPLYFRNRQLFEVWFRALLTEERTLGRRVLVGFDFAFGYPAGFAKAVTGKDEPFAIWEWFDDHITDTPTSNNRFYLAGQLNAKFDGVGPFWGNGTQDDVVGLPRKGKDRTCTAFAEKRMVETKTKGAFSVWQLAGAGAVGSQVMMGLPVLQRLRTKFENQISVWPFEPLDKPIAFVEIWPSLFKQQIKDGPYAHWITDAAQVHVTTAMIANMDAAKLRQTLDVPATSEGWIFGVAP
jgi:hypothetical protein